jgi:eukaryotic-like serine/threonine-protein kinase
MLLLLLVNRRASHRATWATLKPGQTVWDADAKKRTLRLVDGLVGRVLAGRYRLGHLVDDARLCGTYEAVEIETGKAVAIELIARPTDAGAVSGTQFRREAQRIVDTRHEGLRVVRSVAIERGAPFIVSEPVAGESLRDLLTRSGPMPIGESVAVALQVIDAVAAGHAADLVHANLKPEKIRLRATPSGIPHATVMGLGVTTLFGTLRDLDTRSIGTPPYLAPERLAGFTSATPLSDVWCIGLLLFEMIAGHRAFDGVSAEDVARRIVVGGPASLRRMCSAVPVSLDRIVGGALAARPEERLSLRDLRRALHDVQPECAAVRMQSCRVPSSPKLTRDVIYNLSDPCDDFDATTDFNIPVETDLGSL